MIVIGSIRSFIEASHFLPEEMELQKRRILSPNSCTCRERSVCVSELQSPQTTCRPLPEARVRGQLYLPAIAGKMWSTSASAPVSFGDLVLITRNEVSMFLLVSVSWVLFLMLNILGRIPSGLSINSRIKGTMGGFLISTMYWDPVPGCNGVLWECGFQFLCYVTLIMAGRKSLWPPTCKTTAMTVTTTRS